MCKCLISVSGREACDIAFDEFFSDHVAKMDQQKIGESETVQVLELDVPVQGTSFEDAVVSYEGKNGKVCSLYKYP